ncbi:MAG: Nickel pincer cofactor biosynthesis protein LarB [Magnetococcales bacterium]|nr:Nickel pincer cofactor biosynthesis protein LarB [Magnetococcales bacterium]HIJ84823.1 nickel pincer cofactor biosynthesis protein LarB [Magnetococcales bacterium]
MTPHHLRAIIEEVHRGRLDVDAAMQRLARFPVEEIRDHDNVIARLDTHRHLRHGFPEVVLAQGKRWKHLKRIVAHALARPGAILITRCDQKQQNRLLDRFPELRTEDQSRCLYREETPEEKKAGLVAVFSAGTADCGVAMEAAVTARLMGAKVVTHLDSGVAGLHRLLAAGDLMTQAMVFIVVAGMEGALPSVVGGLVDKPVIAVPTSQGYGASFGGLSALLGMLNSCAANVTTVNIDNGFGAGYVAGLINRLAVQSLTYRKNKCGHSGNPSGGPPAPEG